MRSGAGEASRLRPECEGDVASDRRCRADDEAFQLPESVPFPSLGSSKWKLSPGLGPRGSVLRKYS
jgi:hypothetical protein